MFSEACFWHLNRKESKKLPPHQIFLCFPEYCNNWSSISALFFSFIFFENKPHWVYFALEIIHGTCFRDRLTLKSDPSSNLYLHTYVHKRKKYQKNEIKLSLHTWYSFSLSMCIVQCVWLRCPFSNLSHEKICKICFYDNS